MREPRLFWSVAVLVLAPGLAVPALAKDSSVDGCFKGDDTLRVQLAHNVVDRADRLRKNGKVRSALEAACERGVGAACTGRGVITESSSTGDLNQARAD